MSMKNSINKKSIKVSRRQKYQRFCIDSLTLFFDTLLLTLFIDTAYLLGLNFIRMS